MLIRRHRNRLPSLGITAVLAIAGVVVNAEVAPGTPGIPQAPGVVYTENFEHGVGDTLNFDGGSPVVSGSVTESPGSGTCASTHAFTVPGPHTVLVTVRDDDGGVGTATVRVVSYLPAEAWAISASGVVTIPTTPDASAHPTRPSPRPASTCPA